MPRKNSTKRQAKNCGRSSPKFKSSSNISRSSGTSSGTSRSSTSEKKRAGMFAYFQKKFSEQEQEKKKKDIQYQTKDDNYEWNEVLDVLTQSTNI